MYTNLLYDPHAPRRPGSPGLIFKFRDDDQAWQKIVRLIVRLRNNVWQYMGQYKLTAAPPLTPDEWNAQSPKVKLDFACPRRVRECSRGTCKMFPGQANLGEKSFGKKIGWWPKGENHSPETSGP